MSLILKTSKFCNIFLCFIIAGAIIPTYLKRKTCKDFKSWKDSQSYFLQNKAFWLDRDSDGKACEHLKIVESLE